MKLNLSSARGRSVMLPIGILAAMLVVAGIAFGEGERPFRIEGTYVEGCSCALVCSCNLTGKPMPGCHGVGAMSITSGTFNGEDLAGAKVAVGMAPGSWVRVYVEARNPKQKAAAADLAKAAFSAYGRIESVSDAKIELTGSDGRYTVSVDGGKVMQLTTEPFFGLDKKTPVSHSNVMDPFNPTIYQGRTQHASYRDEVHSFTLDGSNSYFNPAMKSSGNI